MNGIYRIISCCIVILLGVCHGGINLPETEELKVKSYSTVFVYPLSDPYDPLNQYGFNHAPSVVQMPDGRVLCCWFSGPYEAAVNQVLLASYSDNLGMAWDRPFVIQDEPRDSDFDPAFIRDGNRVWFFYIRGRWIRYPFVSREKTGRDSYEINVRYTDDNGKSWSQERPIDPAQCRSNGITLSSGELLLPFLDFRDDKNKFCGVLRSEDKGENWIRSEPIDDYQKVGFDEPSLAEMKNGNVIIVFRTNDSHLWTSVSKDKGKTWAKPKKHEMPAGSTSHNIISLKDGRLLLTHNECKAGSHRSPLTCRVSEDGENWSEPLVLAKIDNPGQNNNYRSTQVTYPTASQISDDEVLIVWAKIGISETDQYGEIQSAILKLKDTGKSGD